MQTVKLYRFRGAEVDILLMPIANSRDDYGRPVGGFTMATVQQTARKQGFRMKRDLSPAEWKQVQAMRASGAVKGPIPEETLS